MTLTPAPARARSILTEALWLLRDIQRTLPPSYSSATTARFDRRINDLDVRLSALDKAGIGFTEKGEAGWTVEQEREACAVLIDRLKALGFPADGPEQVALSEAAERIRDRRTLADNAAPAKEMERQDVAAEKDGADSRYRHEVDALNRVTDDQISRAAFAKHMRELAMDLADWSHEREVFNVAIDRFEANTGRSA